MVLIPHRHLRPWLVTSTHVEFEIQNYRNISLVVCYTINECNKNQEEVQAQA